MLRMFSLRKLAKGKHAKVNKNTHLKKPWVERITDENNLWILAMRLENQGDFANAAICYLDDASIWKQQDALPRVALSSVCTANCLIKMGHSDLAKHVLERAGDFFFEHAESVIGWFPRESAWAFTQAYFCYSHAENSMKAEDAVKNYRTISEKLKITTSNTDCEISMKESATKKQNPFGCACARNCMVDSSLLNSIREKISSL